MDKIKEFLKNNFMPIIAWVLALVSAIFIPIDKTYLGYFDFRTLACLFSTMLVIGAYKNIDIFIITAKSLVKGLKNTRALVIALVFITYISSIFIANDMALLTFLPLTIAVFTRCDKKQYIAFTIIMQTVAANLGGMIMPFGNPQSLYLYNYFQIPVSEFVNIMWIPFVVSLVIILSACLFVKKENAEVIDDDNMALNKPRAVIYAIFGIIALLAVFRISNYILATAIIAVGILAIDYKAYKKVDYGLMLTFIAFFIFANNMSRLDTVRVFVNRLLEWNTLLTSVLSCQIISNVPTAIFLSKFTTDYKHLLLAVNIGGTGTLVASLASLISFRAYSGMFPQKTGKYLLKFSIINFSILAVLVILCMYI